MTEHKLQEFKISETESLFYCRCAITGYVTRLYGSKAEALKAAKDIDDWYNFLLFPHEKPATEPDRADLIPQTPNGYLTWRVQKAGSDKESRFVAENANEEFYQLLARDLESAKEESQNLQHANSAGEPKLS